MTAVLRIALGAMAILSFPAFAFDCNGLLVAWAQTLHPDLTFDEQHSVCKASPLGHSPLPDSPCYSSLWRTCEPFGVVKDLSALVYGAESVY